MTPIITFTECLLCARHCSQLSEEGIIISSILPMKKLSYKEVKITVPASQILNGGTKIPPHATHLQTLCSRSLRIGADSITTQPYDGMPHRLLNNLKH